MDSQWQVFRVSPLWNVAWDQEKERRDQDLETSGRTASTNILRMLGEIYLKHHGKIFSKLVFQI